MREFIVTSSSAAGNQNLGTFPATATISQQKSNLSIIIVPPQGGALTFSGTIAEGGATTLDSEAGLMFLEGELPECSFEEATTASEAIPDAGSLTLTAAVAGASCTQGEDGGLLTTEFSVRFQGTEAEAT